MTRRELRQLDRELGEYLESMVEGLGRCERRQALELYLTGLLLDGERKSVEPMAARLVEDEARCASGYGSASPAPTGATARCGGGWPRSWTESCLQSKLL